MNEGKNRFFYAKRHTLRTVNAPATLSAVAVACGMRFINDIVNRCDMHVAIVYGKAVSFNRFRWERRKCRHVLVREDLSFAIFIRYMVKRG